MHCRILVPYGVMSFCILLYFVVSCDGFGCVFLDVDNYVFLMI